MPCSTMELPPVNFWYIAESVLFKTLLSVHCTFVYPKLTGQTIFSRAKSQLFSSLKSNQHDPRKNKNRQKKPEPHQWTRIERFLVLSTLVFQVQGFSLIRAFLYRRFFRCAYTRNTQKGQKPD